MSQEPQQRELENALPHDAEAERVVVGSIFMDNSLIAEAINIVKDEDFYVPAYRYIYEAQTSLFSMSKEISPLLVSQELTKAGRLQAVGDLNYISSLMDMLPVILSLESYARVVKDKSMLRQLYKAVNKIGQEVLAQEDEANVILDNANKAVFEVTIQHTNKSFSKLGNLVHQSIQKTHELQQSQKALTGVDTGFVDLNALTLGWQPSDLILIAARPGIGKSALGMQLAQNAAIRAGICVAVFSLEMPEEQLTARAICCEARVDGTKYRSGMYVSAEEWEKIHSAEQLMAEAPLWIDDTPGVTTLQIRAKVMRLATELAGMGLDLGLIVVDYMQLMMGSVKRFESRQQELTQISRELKSIAREMGLPLVAMSQLNRSPENRTNHRPMLSDLRESGALEQDADVVAFIYRGDEYKGPGETPDHIAEIILAKHRNGPTGTINLRFDKPSTRFDDYSYNEQT